MTEINKGVTIGNINRLKVLRKVSVGLFLDGGTLGDILMPRKYVVSSINQGDEIDVFVYLDSEDRFIATTETPIAMVGGCAFLEVVAVNRVGAFLNWGLQKELLAPFREQASPMKPGERHLVYIYIDPETGRIAASSRYWNFIDNVVPKYKAGQEVAVMIAAKTQLGYKAIINNSHSGVIYSNQVFKPLVVGQKLQAYVGKVREDDKIDLVLEPPGYQKTPMLAQKVVEVLKAKGGYLPVTDKTPPSEIYNLFGLSKKSFKMVIGALYKSRQVVLEENGIRLRP